MATAIVAHGLVLSAVATADPAIMINLAEVLAPPEVAARPLAAAPHP